MHMIQFVCMLFHFISMLDIKRTNHSMIICVSFTLKVGLNGGHASLLLLEENKIEILL